MRILAVTVLLALSACAGDEEIEGDDAGECSDGADNDQDAYFDCDDNGCWNSPDCDGGETDTDTDADSDSDSDADADSDADSDSDTDADPCPPDPNGPFNHITSVRLTSNIDLDIDDENSSLCVALCETYNAVCDCDMDFGGYADEVVAVCGNPSRITLKGSFGRTASTCDVVPGDGQYGIIEQGVWGNDAATPNNVTSTPYITLLMSATNPGYLDAVMAHDGLTNSIPPADVNDANDGQWAVFQMRDTTFALNQTSVDYTETYTHTPDATLCKETWFTTLNLEINGQ